MPGLYAQYKVYIPGEILTALDLNATDRQHIVHNVPASVESFSTTLEQSRIQISSATLAISLADELARYREKLRLLGGVTFWDQITGPAPLSGFIIPAMRGVNGTATGGSPIMVLAADAILFSNGTKRNTIPYTSFDLTVQGPGGRDRAATFAHQWAELYFIWNPTSGIVSSLVSSQKPPQGPILGPLTPGYTEWAYACSVRVGVASQWLFAGTTIEVNGSYVSYHPAVSVLSNGSATVETTINIGIFVPSHYLSTRWAAIVWPRPIASAGGVNVSTVSIRLHPGFNYRTYGTEISGIGGPFGARAPAYETIMPTHGDLFRYLVTNSIGTVAVDIGVSGYYIANGDV